MTLRRIPVAGAAPYDVVVGEFSAEQLRSELAGALTGALGHAAHRVGLVVAGDPALAPVRVTVERALHELGFAVTVLDVPPGEAGKTATVAASCWEQLGTAGFTRSDAIVTLGGGATTDLGGFVAATWLRGVSVVHIPTTVLAMVDAAVGGKTGINTAAGKNLVGSFHEPAAVLCDLTLLATLPHAELVAGLAESIKCGFFADPLILELVETHSADQIAPGSALLAELIVRAIEVKAAVVAQDLTEQGGPAGHPGREVLNYGHTLAHAIERVENYQIRHGEAVAIGCVFVAELAARVGTLAPAIVARHRAVFHKVGLPTSYQRASFEDLLAGMRIDKKSRGDTLRFVVLRDLGDPVILTGPNQADLEAAYAAIGAAQ